MCRSDLCGPLRDLYVGYLSTREVETKFWSKLVPEALDMAVEATTALLHEVFAG